MTKEEVKALLDSYKENRARLEFLQMEAEELRRGIIIENRPEVHAIHAQGYESARSQTFKSSIVETLGLRSLDGETYADADRWQRELDVIENEIRKKTRAVRAVDIWLSALTDQERAAVEGHDIDHKTWEQVSLASPRTMGHFVTADGVRKIGRAALERICNIAR